MPSATMESRLATCEVHGIPFAQVFFPASGQQEGFWTGSCPKCEDDKKDEERVNDYLRSQENVIVSEATKIIQERAHQAAIERRTKKDLAADVAEFEKERLPLWKDYHTSLEWNQIVCEIEDRKRTEFLQTLKCGG